MKAAKEIFSFFFLIPLMAFVSGCGYSVRSALPASLRTICVESFKNKIDFTNENKRNTYFPLLEIKVRNAIVDRIQFDGAMRIAAAEKAAWILNGDLMGYERQPIRYDENENVTEYRVQIILNLTLFDTKQKLDAWIENGFVGEATYFPTGSKAISESAALDLAMVDLGRRVVERLVENW